MHYVSVGIYLGSSILPSPIVIGNLSFVLAGICLLLIISNLICMWCILLSSIRMFCTWGRSVSSCRIPGLRASRSRPYIIGNDQPGCMSNTFHYIEDKPHSTCKTHSYTVSINSNWHLNIVCNYPMSYKPNTIHSLKHNYPDTLYMSYWHYTQHLKHNFDCSSTYIPLYIVNISLLLSDCIHNNLIGIFLSMCCFSIWILTCMSDKLMLTGMTCIVVGIGNIDCLTCRMLSCRLYNIGW